MPRYVEEGDRVRLSMPGGLTETLIVGAPCEEQEGHWYCDTHHEGFPHNLAGTAHYADKAKSDPNACRFVWICHHHGPEPPSKEAS